MTLINGVPMERRDRICDICGARLRIEKQAASCPNILRDDHQGKPYAAGARLTKGDLK